MPMSSNIIILSQPVQSGKTTALMKRMHAVDNCDGVLTPDVAGLRKLLLIKQRTLIDFENTIAEDAVSIGRFHFSNDAFQKAHDYLLSIEPRKDSEIIIDEIGKLELEGKGFHKALLHHLDLVRDSSSSHRLILVVRDSLLEEVKMKFNMQDAYVISTEDLTENKFMMEELPVNGIVLCGGQSARMGRDKAFIRYRQSEQFRYLAGLFSELHIPVLISCNENQQELFPEEFETITDDEAFKDNGPVSGLLTAHTYKPGHSFILLGCDYPLIEKKQVAMLQSLSRYGYEAVCFVKQSDGPVNEPLLTYYSHSFLENLLVSFQNGNRSIKKLLDISNALKIITTPDDFLKSFDTPEDFNSFVFQST